MSLPVEHRRRRWSGWSKPLSTLTSVDLPAPFGPIRPDDLAAMQRRASTSCSAWTPSNERETAEARSDSPGLRSDCMSSVKPS